MIKQDTYAVDLLMNTLSALADELGDMALEVAALGESLSAGEPTGQGKAINFQKFDALTQALNAYAHVLQGLSSPLEGEPEESLSGLLEKIPFFDTRERIRARLFLDAPRPLSNPSDDVWVEC